MYDTPVRMTYGYTGVNFAAGDAVRVIKNPRKGTKGKVRSINIHATTTFAGATTKPKVQIGDGVTANKYADVDGGTTAAGAAMIARDQAGGITAMSVPAVLTATDGDLTVTFKAPTGAGLAGVGDVHIEVEWL